MHCIDAAQDCANSVVTCEKLTMGPSSTFAACHTDVGSGRTQSQGYAIVSHPVHMRAWLHENERGWFRSMYNCETLAFELVAAFRSRTRALIV